jgi:hypothetical protein
MSEIEQHDGNLDTYSEGGHATIEYVSYVSAHPILISGGHGNYDIEAVFLDVKQALSLLEWLRQQEPMLKQKAQELSMQE